MDDAPPSSGAGGTDRPPIWSRPERGSRGPVPTHSRDSIAEAAVLLADQRGLAAVSMRAVASALGTSAGSLYRYLSSREDLLDLMADRVTRELRPYPSSEGNWLDAMLLVAHGQRALYRRHTWLLDVVQRPAGFGPESLAWFDSCLRILEPVPSSVTAKFEAIAMMTGVVSLFARSETTSGSRTFGLVEPGAHPHLEAALRQAPGSGSGQDLFERTLRILLTGLLLTGAAGDAIAHEDLGQEPSCPDR